MHIALPHDSLRVLKHLMRAWLATMAASVETISIGQKQELGVADQNTAVAQVAGRSGRAEYRARAAAKPVWMDQDDALGWAVDVIGMPQGLCTPELEDPKGFLAARVLLGCPEAGGPKDIPCGAGAGVPPHRLG
jgi:hypothetical protein